MLRRANPELPKLVVPKTLPRSTRFNTHVGPPDRKSGNCTTDKGCMDIRAHFVRFVSSGLGVVQAKLTSRIGAPACDRTTCEKGTGEVSPCSKRNDRIW